MAQTVRQHTQRSGLRGGLVVHHDCGDGELILALGRGDSWVVEGLSRDARQVERCRRAIESQTGQLRHFTTYETAEEEGSRSGFASGKPSNQLLRGAANDLLLKTGKTLYLKNLRLDTKDLSVHPSVWPYTQFTKEQPWQKDFGESPLVSTGGFLDDTLYDRTCYICPHRRSGTESQ